MRKSKKNSILEFLLNNQVNVIGALIALTLAPSSMAPAIPSDVEALKKSVDDSVLIVAAGDIVCDHYYPRTRTKCVEERTAALVEEYDPEKVFALGDLQYENGTIDQFENTYSKTWGRFKEKTIPILGNHEYFTPNADGYFTYFKSHFPKRTPYYRTNVGEWQVFALDSNCGHVDCKSQVKWFRRELKKNPSRCSAVLMHHPRWSSGAHGNNRHVAPFWKAAINGGVDVVLSGHDHNYERFKKLGKNGKVHKRGVRSFVVGTGGKETKPRARKVFGSSKFLKRSGVLAMRFEPTRFNWEFKSIDGVVRDKGAASCSK